MNLVLQILIGLGIAAVGVYFVFKTETILEFFGVVEWAETKIGPGGTRLFYKLLGIVIIFLGFVVATNLWNALLQATIGKLFVR
ncbi:MAG TPA: hypothetical protein VFQ60_00590 [Patescibacteria group bacterium]|nr:hypothetical protein [Patescibacteria group bacterium]